MCRMLSPAERFYNDLPGPEQQHWVSQLRLSPVNTQTTAITHAAYRYHPSTYLFCENDCALPVEVQRMMVQQVNAELMDQTGTLGELVSGVATESCTAGHSPFLSQPNTVLKLVERILRR